MKYKLVESDGKTTERKIMSLKQMQDFVGGYIEQVGDIYCNEDGLRLGLPMNVSYTKFVGNIILVVKNE